MLDLRWRLMATVSGSAAPTLFPKQAAMPSACVSRKEDDVLLAENNRLQTPTVPELPS